MEVDYMSNYKFYELDCGVKAKENKEYGCEICRGLVDAEYSIAIKAEHEPTFEEAEEFIKDDLKRLGYDGVNGITPKTETVLDEIDWGNGRKFKCHSYWNDDTSFALDIGDGELTDKDDNPYFIHCEYNCDNGMWHHIFEIWFEDDDTCSIYDIPESDRNEYLSETEIEELRGIIYNLCKDKINL